MSDTLDRKRQRPGSSDDKLTQLKKMATPFTINKQTATQQNGNRQQPNQHGKSKAKRQNNNNSQVKRQNNNNNNNQAKNGSQRNNRHQQSTKANALLDSRTQPPKNVQNDNYKIQSSTSAVATSIKPQTDANRQSEPAQLIWTNRFNRVPKKIEKDVEPMLLRWAKERGMMLSQPPFRLEKILQFCKKNHFSLAQALSLRRHLIKQANPFRRMSHLGLGEEHDIKKTSELFEEAIENVLQDQSVEYIGEEEQRQIIDDAIQKQVEANETTTKGTDANTVHIPKCTPDFRFDPPVLLQIRNKNGKVERTQLIHWLEVKNFYGASIIPFDTNKSAVGCLEKTVTKYVNAFSNGAIVFSEGCGADLAHRLESLGAVVLDSGVANMRPVQDYQRTWCGDAKGRILM